MTTDELLMDLKQRNPLTFVPFNICYKILDSKTNTVPFAKINLKGVAEQSSVFASEIITAISPIPEEPPEIINMNKIHEVPRKELTIELNPATFLSKYENNKIK